MNHTDNTTESIVATEEAHDDFTSKVFLIALAVFSSALAALLYVLIKKINALKRRRVESQSVNNPAQNQQSYPNEERISCDPPTYEELFSISENFSRPSVDSGIDFTVEQVTVSDSSTTSSLSSLSAADDVSASGSRLSVDDTEDNIDWNSDDSTSSSASTSLNANMSPMVSREAIFTLQLPMTFNDVRTSATATKTSTNISSLNTPRRLGMHLSICDLTKDTYILDMPSTPPPSYDEALKILHCLKQENNSAS